MFQKKFIGKLGEDIARKYLIEKGHQIVDKNNYCRFGELDIVSCYKGKYHFIEVKTLRSSSFPEKSLTYKKQINWLKSIYNYLAENPIDDWQADLIIINLYKHKAFITYLQNFEFNEQVVNSF